MKCSMCQTSEEYRKFFIKEFKYWKVELHGNQCYLGRCIVVLKRHLEDLFEISKEERNELFEVMQKLKRALKESFNPDLMNYSSLGNEIRHLHLHVIPRYRRPVEFSGLEFVDERWGQNPAPYARDFNVSDEIYKQLVSAISSRI